MKKFKKDDVIRRKDDDVKGREYTVLNGTDSDWAPATASRSDDGATFLSGPFVLGRPEDYKLVHRPSKKDREIKQLQARLSEAEKGLSEERQRRREDEQLADLKLLDAGLVRLDLLRTHTVMSPQSSGDGQHTYFEVKMLVEGHAINEIVRAWKL